MAFCRSKKTRKITPQSAGFLLCCRPLLAALQVRWLLRGVRGLADSRQSHCSAEFCSSLKILIYWSLPPAVLQKESGDTSHYQFSTQRAVWKREEFPSSQIFVGSSDKTCCQAHAVSALAHRFVCMVFKFVEPAVTWKWLWVIETPYSCHKRLLWIEGKHKWKQQFASFCSMHCFAVE